MSTELEVEMGERTTLNLAVHYERNDFASGLSRKERKGANEDVFQCDAKIRYR